MPKKLPDRFRGLVDYLCNPHEKANEDLVISYFRRLFGAEFTRQADAKNADGYVEGTLVLELKGTTKWYPGLFQGLAYNKDLDYSLIVVAAKEFLSVWRLDDIPEEIRAAAIEAMTAPNETGRRLAKQYEKLQFSLLKAACWRLRSELLAGLFTESPEVLAVDLEVFEEILRAGRRVRTRITTKNFPIVLKQMREFFDPALPTAPARAFYSLLFGWNEGSKVGLSAKQTDQATLGGEVIHHLLPNKRVAFKEFVEGRCISLTESESHDDFFAQYDRALDVVDPGFRKRNGIYFTDLDLSRFVMGYVRHLLGDIGKNHLVIDPACGSGNLVTNWRSPLELRHKVVSEIEPELLFAVERRMKGDQWHDGRFTVVPRTSENRGLNFLDKSGAEYLAEIQHYLEEKGYSANRPIAILCNPPFRSDDDQTVSAIKYEIHQSILDEIGLDASSERYCCFLSQMKQIAQVAKDTGVPGKSLILVFTKAAWLTDRPVFSQVRAAILGSFEDLGGLLVSSREFFDVQGEFPVAFTLWRYKGDSAALDAQRPVHLLDLTWLTKEMLHEVPWSDPNEAAVHCERFIKDQRSLSVIFALGMANIREWTGCKRFDFQREKTKEEQRTANFRCGLPAGDRRHHRKKTLGHADGQYVGFMDDMTPCRIRQPMQPVPYFHLDSRFMRVRRYRCFSGPADNRSFAPTTLEQAEKLFVWFALGRTFAQEAYPMWADAFELWPPIMKASTYGTLVRFAYAIGFADNECVSITFPANNPIKGASEVRVINPMTPLDSASYWSKVMAPIFTKSPVDHPARLVAAVKAAFAEWERLVNKGQELHMDTLPSYMIGSQPIARSAGLLQIRDYAREAKDATELHSTLAIVTEELRSTKEALASQLRAKPMSYFSQGESKPWALEFKPRTKFENVLDRRLALAAYLILHSRGDANLGRTKLAKLIYMSDAVNEGLAIEMQYEAQAAGPLDSRAFYNESIGLEPFAKKIGCFVSEEAENGVTRYKPGPTFERMAEHASDLFTEKQLSEVRRVISLLLPLDTEQSEIVATLYACWDARLRKKQSFTDDELFHDVHAWHEKKRRFQKDRLVRALKWMRQKQLVPSGKGPSIRSRQSNVLS